MTSSVPSPVHLAALPRLPSTHIKRPRLAQPLLANACRLNLICAPAGFGKSVLLNECVRQLPGDTRVLWLDLLGQALTPAELLARLGHALNQHPAPGSGEPLEQLTQLLSHQEQPLLIVLDDYPRQPCGELDACLERLLERGPHTLRWWISGRRRPAWNLPRLLLQGDLQEYDAHDLALDAQELTRLLEQRQLLLSSELQEQLLHHSEGWLAGICLLLMQGGGEQLGERLQQGSALLLEYLEREVLEGLPTVLREALIALSHIPRFSAALCAVLFDEDNGPELLATLRSRQLFLHRLDHSNEWFRLWRPLATALRRLPQPRSPQRLHLLACRWFAERGDVRAAVEHALAAEQPEVAANYLQQYGQEQLLIGNSVAQFLQWRSELPASLFSSTPRLIALQAWALIISTRLDEADQCVQDLPRFLPQPDARRQQQLLAQYQAIRGVIERQRGLRSARQHCLEALEQLPASAWSQRMLCQQALAQQAMAELDLPTAQQYCQAALQNARQKGSVLYEALLNVDRVHLLSQLGELDTAQQVVEDNLQRLREAGRQGPVAARLWLLKGSLLFAQEQAEAAEAALRQGLQVAEQSQDAYLLFGYVGLAELAGERGEYGEALQLLHKAERQMQWLHVAEVRYRQVLRLAHGQLALRQQAYDHALQLFGEVIDSLASGGQLAPSGFYDLALRARLCQAQALLAMTDASGAQRVLAPLLEECQTRGYRRLAAETRLSLAHAGLQQGAVDAALAQLRPVLADVTNLRLLPALRTVVQHHAEDLAALFDDPAHGTLLSQLAPGAAQTEPARTCLLSGRERKVLQLIASGLSNQQIAEQLYISLHTVKTHARRINVKLGVVRRTQAVAQAKALGWLD